VVRIIDAGMFIGIAVHTLYSFYTDIRTRRIPNVWNLCIALAGILFHLVSGGLNGLLFALAGLGLLLIVSLVLQLCGAIGGGDVKWFAALGAWAGISFSMQTFICTMLIAGAIGAGVFLYQGVLFQQIRQWLHAITCALLMKDAAHVRVSRQRAIQEIPLMIAVVPAITVVYWTTLGGA
jgi:prepilin peptidase CpaA